MLTIGLCDRCMKMLKGSERPVHTLYVIYPSRFFLLRYGRLPLGAESTLPSALCMGWPLSFIGRCNWSNFEVLSIVGMDRPVLNSLRSGKSVGWQTMNRFSQWAISGNVRTLSCRLLYFVVFLCLHTPPPSVEKDNILLLTDLVINCIAIAKVGKLLLWLWCWLYCAFNRFICMANFCKFQIQ